MIVINAEGAKDVRKLRRLARSLDGAELLDGSEIRQLAPARKREEAGVSLLPGVAISPATRQALMNLEQTDLVMGAEYEGG